MAAPGGSKWSRTGRAALRFFSRRGAGFLRLPGLRGVRSDANAVQLRGIRPGAPKTLRFVSANSSCNATGFVARPAGLLYSLPSLPPGRYRGCVRRASGALEDHPELALWAVARG